MASLKTLLHDIRNTPSPSVSNPPGCSKRASVALIIRLRPTFPHRASYDSRNYIASDESLDQNLNRFFDQEWVETGEPEVLFIKRAARKGDRWTGHIALPGGKRDPIDQDDRAVSARETQEETGMDLKTNHCLPIGNLPERIVTTSWGTIPLMVLCPFVYLLLRHDIAPLSLQPEEVHSAHWVPIHQLLSSSCRTYERCDISDRLALRRSPVVKSIIRASAGQLLFSAVQLSPSESLYSHFATDAASHESKSSTKSKTYQRISGLLAAPKRRFSHTEPLLLWGLTLGVVADLLERFDNEATAHMWSWPTFSHWDIRAVVWIVTYRFRSCRTQQLKKGSEQKSSLIPRLSGLDNTTSTISILPQEKAPGAELAKAHLLDDYFMLMRKALAVTLGVRLGAAIVMALLLDRRCLFPGN